MNGRWKHGLRWIGYWLLVALVGALIALVIVGAAWITAR